MKQGAIILSLLFIAFTFVSFKPAPPKKGKMVWGQVVHLNAEEAGSESKSKGLALLALTDDMQLTYMFIIPKVDKGDRLTSAQIRLGEAGQNGPYVTDLSAGVKKPGRFHSIKLFPKEYYYILNQQNDESLYVVVNSMLYPDGSIRGQIDY